MDIVIAGLLALTALLLISGRPIQIKIQHEHLYTGDREVPPPVFQPEDSEPEGPEDPNRPVVHLDGLIQELNNIMLGGDDDRG